MSITRIHHLATWLLLAAVAVACTRNGASSQQNGANSTDATAPAPPATGPVTPDQSWQAPQGLEVAVLAGGCFWGMEEILRSIPGVTDTEVGYTGGALPNPTYDDLHDGNSGHAESVRVFFDPKVLSYADLLEKWFFRMHDPTTKNRQGNDVGSQYRSAIFVTSEAQRRVALEVIQRVDKSGNWKAPIVTEVVDAGKFTRAEGYHQDYLQRTPNGYTCHYLRDHETI